MKEANKVDFNGGLVVLTGFIPSTPQNLKIISQKVEWPMGTLDCQHEQSLSKNWMPQKPMVYPLVN